MQSLCASFSQPACGTFEWYGNRRTSSCRESDFNGLHVASDVVAVRVLIVLDGDFFAAACKVVFTREPARQE
jgi:hypothetical protein